MDFWFSPRPRQPGLRQAVTSSYLKSMFFPKLSAKAQKASAAGRTMAVVAANQSRKRLPGAVCALSGRLHPAPAWSLALLGCC